MSLKGQFAAQPLFVQKVVVQEFRLVGLGEAALEGHGGGPLVKRHILRFENRFGRDAVVQGQLMHRCVGINFHHMDIGEIQPADTLDKIQGHARLFGGFGGKAVHRVQFKNHMGVGFGDISQTVPELFHIEIFTYQFLQSWRRRLEGHRDIHGSCLHHQIDEGLRQNIAP